MNYRKKAMLMAGALLCLNLSIYSQSISLKMSNVSVKKAMTELQTKSGYSFVYIAGDVDTDRTVSINASQLRDAVAQILRGQNVSYEIQGKNIVIKKGSQQQVTSSEKKKKVTGTVKDSNGEPIIGATVVEKGTTNGTITDMDGNYSLTVNDLKKAVLQASFIGYNTIEESVKGRSTVEIKLSPSVVNLGEVVAIGYGTQTRREITGSVANVSEESFNKGITRDASDLLQGKVAGLTITSGSGDVTRGSTMPLRGTSTMQNDQGPLIVIDGIPGGDMSTVAPSDIESISVLKDASSAAIYGAQAANGVILITTKKGTRSGQPKLTYDGYVGVQKTGKRYDVLNSMDRVNLE